MINRGRRILPALAISFLAALLAYSALMSTALAQGSADRVCPLSDEQAQKSIQVFDKDRQGLYGGAALRQLPWSRQSFRSRSQRNTWRRQVGPHPEEET
jgi:hypothetical protein